jgi:hypothetical protein
LIQEDIPSTKKNKNKNKKRLDIYLIVYLFFAIFLGGFFFSSLKYYTMITHAYRMVSVLGPMKLLQQFNQLIKT